MLVLFGQSHSLCTLIGSLGYTSRVLLGERRVGGSGDLPWKERPGDTVNNPCRLKPMRFLTCPCTDSHLRFRLPIEALLHHAF